MTHTVKIDRSLEGQATILDPTDGQVLGFIQHRSTVNQYQVYFLINGRLQNVALVDSEQIGFALIRAYLRDLVFGHAGLSPIPPDGDWSF